MTPTEKLQDIYDHEINVRLEWFWDRGVDAFIGDELNGWKRDAMEFETVEKAIDWLWAETVGKLHEAMPACCAREPKVMRAQYIIWRKTWAQPCTTGNWYKDDAELMSSSEFNSFDEFTRLEDREFEK